MSRKTVAALIASLAILTFVVDFAEAQGRPGCEVGSTCWVKCGRAIHPLHGYKSMDACVREWAANNLAPEAAIAQEQDSVDGDITEKKGATPKARRAILIAVNEPVIDHPAEYKKPALSEPAIQT